MAATTSSMAASGIAVAARSSMSGAASRCSDSSACTRTLAWCWNPTSCLITCPQCSSSQPSLPRLQQTRPPGTPHRARTSAGSPYVPGSLLKQADRVRLPQPRQPVVHPVHDPKRLSARGEHVEAREPPEEAVDEIGDGGHNVLAVVEYYQDISVGKPLGERVLVRRPPDRCIPSWAATSLATRSADRSEASQTTNTPSGNRADDSAATARASAVLPTPAGPVSVVNGTDATLSATSAISRSLPTSPPVLTTEVSQTPRRAGTPILGAVVIRRP
jgi:hypothetical protein